MPAATQSKRIKNIRIERPFIIGSEAWPLTEKDYQDGVDSTHTKGWRVYVRGIEGQPPLETWLKKVQFKIFHTYNNPTRMVDTPPFEVRETGWGGFMVDIKLFFLPEVNSKAEPRQHFLQLEPYGDEEMQVRQAKERMVRSEFLEYVEFNEPTETLYDALTDESQFVLSKRGKGKTKEELSVELHDRSSETNQFTKETEGKQLEGLEKAYKEVEELLTSEAQRGKKVHEELMHLRAENAATANG